MKAFWNQRYSEADYAYGILPNEYLKTQLATLPPGRILFPAEGEGRNAVYASTLGWQVYAFDFSEAARHKALALAAKTQVTMHYQIGDLLEVNYPAEWFDAVALIFVHLSPPLRQALHARVTHFLKPGGTLLIEAFSKDHLRFNSMNEYAGGPKDVTLLTSRAELEVDFKCLHITELYETETLLQEGKYHAGQSAVVRLTATKPL
jgi:ubiquinone/menaquinone biosynthesis C-methylase UbiE